MKINLDIRHRRLAFIRDTEQGASFAAKEYNYGRTKGFRNGGGSWFHLQNEEGTYIDYQKFRAQHRQNDYDYSFHAGVERD